MTTESLFAVIVAYNPNSTFESGLASVAEQASDIVVVNNGWTGLGTHGMLDRAAHLRRVHLLRILRDLAMAAALNRGFCFRWKTGRGHIHDNQCAHRDECPASAAWSVSGFGSYAF